MEKNKMTWRTPNNRWCLYKNFEWMGESSVDYDTDVKKLLSRLVYNYNLGKEPRLGYNYTPTNFNDVFDNKSPRIENLETLAGKHTRKFGIVYWTLMKAIPPYGYIPLNCPYLTNHIISNEEAIIEIEDMDLSPATTVEALSFFRDKLSEEEFSFFQQWAEIKWLGDILKDQEGKEHTPSIFDSGGCRGLLIYLNESNSFDPGEYYSNYRDSLIGLLVTNKQETNRK